MAYEFGSSGDYLNSPQGQLAQYFTRRRRRFLAWIEGIEPRSKTSMPERDKDELQGRLLGSMKTSRRKAFRGPIALRVRMQTTVKAPTHAHNVAKNLLDLFATPRPALKSTRRGLLYADDAQVHGLSVTCVHGQEKPQIDIAAYPMRSLVQDAQLAAQAYDIRKEDDDHLTAGRTRELDELFETLKRLRTDESSERQLWGDSGYDTMLRHYRRRAQELLLAGSALTARDVAHMYPSDPSLGSIWDAVIHNSPLRIQLSELPQVSGSSVLWENEIEEKLRAFRAYYGWIVNPLLVPVALEVVIKPPPPSRQNGLHDLDNVLRSYLIPRVVEVLRPISSWAFMFDDEHRDEDGNRARTPPRATKWGVSRYEAWRLPPAQEGERGFVSVAIVSDLTGHADMFGQIDDLIEDWRGARC